MKVKASEKTVTRRRELIDILILLRKVIPTSTQTVELVLVVKIVAQIPAVPSTFRTTQSCSPASKVVRRIHLFLSLGLAVSVTCFFVLPTDRLRYLLAEVLRHRAGPKAVAKRIRSPVVDGASGKLVLIRPILSSIEGFVGESSGHDCGVEADICVVSQWFESVLGLRVVLSSSRVREQKRGVRQEVVKPNAPFEAYGILRDKSSHLGIVVSGAIVIKAGLGVELAASVTE